jgi:oxygen-independent coproporphyrinogen-3 oxidase
VVRDQDVEERPPPWLWPRAAYIHVPFCAHHCCYCDFAVAAGKDDQIDRYLMGLAAELSTLGTPEPVNTLFLGGGTPTHLAPTQLKNLLAAVTHWLPIRAGGEFSVEANPSTISPDKARVLCAFGVNRVSLGVQSFRPELLRFLERDHGSDEVRQAIVTVRNHECQVSLDLIFGVPGQTLSDWKADLRTALAFEPDHLSTYGLTYEKGTRLWKQWQRGGVRPLDEEAERAQYELAMDLLGEAGFEHYEISNFARPGRRCRHNQVYWANEAYFGFGMGAARYVHGARELNTRDLETYLRRTLAGQSATFQREVLDGKERARETMALQFRRAEGILRARFCAQTGFALEELAGPVLNRLLEVGVISDDGDGVRLTRKGKCVADTVIRELL